MTETTEKKQDSARNSDSESDNGSFVHISDGEENNSPKSMGEEALWQRAKYDHMSLQMQKLEGTRALNSFKTKQKTKLFLISDCYQKILIENVELRKACTHQHSYIFINAILMQKIMSYELAPPLGNILNRVLVNLQ